MTFATRCPVCDGRVRPQDAWCSQCLTELRPPPVPVPQPAGESADPAGNASAGGAPGDESPGDEAAGDEAAGDEAAGDEAAGDDGGEPAGDGGVDRAAVERLAADWGSRLAASERGAGLPALLAMTGAPGARAGLTAGAAVAVLGVLLVLMAVGGLVL
jgi:hypothetical protein